MESKKRSLSFAKQYRLCPPPHVKMDPLYAAEIKNHHSLCPYCSDQMASEMVSWEALAMRLKSILDSSLLADAIPGPHGSVKGNQGLEEGSVCSVRQNLGRWQEGYFYNPPTVLVLETTAAISDEVLVAQTYHDITLAGPGDLILESNRSPCGKFFVEAWNTYTLRSRDLAPAVARVNEGVVEAVKALQEDASVYPGWAVCPEHMEEHDARIYFREMEVEVGYTFSSEAAAGLMEEIKRPSLRLVHGTIEDTVEEIRHMTRDIQWPVEPQSIEQALATARFPPDRYAMAAASADRELLSANLVTLRSGKVGGIAPLEGEIFERHEETEGLVIGGRLFTPQGIEILEVLCFLQTGDGDFISSEITDWDQEGYFRARFPVSSLDQMDLYVAALWEALDD